MSTTMSDISITVREFSGDSVNYRVNPDMPLQLKQGGNEYGEIRDAVLVKIGLDGLDYSNVEVYTRSHQAGQTDADTLDIAIESLIVVRDQLRKMAAKA